VNTKPHRLAVLHLFLFFHIQLIPTTACLALPSSPSHTLSSSHRLDQQSLDKQHRSAASPHASVSDLHDNTSPPLPKSEASRRLSRSPPLTGLRLMCIHQSCCFSSNGLGYLHCHAISGSAFLEGRFAVPVMTSTISSKDRY
jgi:hypothetical protein